MKVPALMRKQFESAYPDNAKLKACEWCVLYHCYRVNPDPSRKPGNTGAKDEQAVAALLQKFMDRKAREAYEALHPVPNGFTWAPATGYSFLFVPHGDYERGEAGRLDRQLEAFTVGYQEMFETIYDEEVTP